MANINNIAAKLTKFFSKVSRIYVTDNEGTPTDSYVFVNEISSAYETLTSFPTGGDLLFDNNYSLPAAQAYNMDSGDLTLSLEGAHAPLIGKKNYLRVIGNGVNSINLNAGDFDTNDIFPKDLDGKILPVGTYVIECTYDVDGIRIRSSSGSEAIAEQPPVITEAIISDTDASWNLYFNEPVSGTDGFSFFIDGSPATINTTTEVSGTHYKFTTTVDPVSGETCTFTYSQVTGNCTSDATGLALLEITEPRELENRLSIPDLIEGISGLTDYFLASDIDGDNTLNSAYTNGQQIQTWTSKSITANTATQSNTALRPVLNKEWVIGQDTPVLDFSNKILNLATDIDFGQNQTIVIAGYNIIGAILGRNPGSLEIQPSFIELNLKAGGLPITLSSLNHINQVVFLYNNATELFLYLNDDTSATDSIAWTVVTQDYNFIGGTQEVVGNTGCTCNLGAIVTFNKVLNQTERENVNTTLRGKLNWQS